MARHVEDTAMLPPSLVSKILANHGSIRLHPLVGQLWRHDGGARRQLMSQRGFLLQGVCSPVVLEQKRADVDAIIYYTRYRYSFPFRNIEVDYAVVNMAWYAICSSLILVIHDNMINETNHIVEDVLVDISRSHGCNHNQSIPWAC
jgi:hypothetical protein